MALGTVATIALVGASLAGTGYGIYAGERSNDLQTAARRRTKALQDEALRVQMVERARSVKAEMDAANRPSPASTIEDPDGSLQSDRTGGVSDRLKLARRSTLGGF